MSPILRVALALFVLWVLVATNPSASSNTSFSTFITAVTSSTTRPLRQCHPGDYPLCVESRRAYPGLSLILEALFAPHRVDDARLRNLHFESTDYTIFTVVRSIPMPTSDNPGVAFIGILTMWLPVPHPARLTGSVELPHLIRVLRSRVRSVRRAAFANQAGRSFEAFRETSLPDRPWEWLIACFSIVGALWFMIPARARNHFTLTWQNVRQNGHWWCMVFFHLSHGGSLLRLFRTIVSVNYLAPLLVSDGRISLSGLYGVLLTSSATSTALAMLVLARRYVFGTLQSRSSTPLEINGGGACVYALLVVACLSPSCNEPLPGGARPFELLMLNVLFDSFFLAGQKRIADYTAHTGAALGAWLFCSINMSVASK
ncbi:hypothetical protein BWQ96_06586 [Gracilariopsis chorda]|uniref:Peptidase S54 rhomboid domain-containing protein n=1 Tax=Gracilariopsis chorda TaxID=448386 RepID=A0A2V3INL8_9FLOR|nr:hypothetical protein BWQ96_06586 [Gracilariopsis chorda]|eukprot:PXF43681.1 hypothetical protein BWQ96_06586 [Gracilariopsis chorda]